MTAIIGKVDPFQIIEHPADVGFLAYGAALPELFENAALAMCSLATDASNIREAEQCDISATGGDVESLLYAWLAEILAVADADQLVFRRVGVTMLKEPRDGQRGEVRGTAYGEKFDRARHAAGTYIKAVTLHQFSVEQIDGGYRARVFLDL